MGTLAPGFAPLNTGLRTMKTSTLFKDSLSVVNVGLAAFADNIVAAGGECIGLEWKPPAQGDRDGAWALAETLAHPAIDAANAVALARFIDAHPALIDVANARDVLPGMAGGRRLIVHAGPPIAWARDVRADARRGAGRRRPRRLGGLDRRGRAPRRERRGRPRALPPPRGGRADGRHHQPVDAAVRGRERGRGQPRVQQLQRRPRQRAALRRQRARGRRPACA